MSLTCRRFPGLHAQGCKGHKRLMNATVGAILTSFLYLFELSCWINAQVALGRRLDLDGQHLEQLPDGKRQAAAPCEVCPDPIENSRKAGKGLGHTSQDQHLANRAFLRHDKGSVLPSSEALLVNTLTARRMSCLPALCLQTSSREDHSSGTGQECRHEGPSGS